MSNISDINEPIEQEKKVIEITVQLWSEFLKLPEMHPDDCNEMRMHIHAIQEKIFAREGIRKHKLCH